MAGCAAVGFWVGFSEPLPLPSLSDAVEAEEFVTFRLIGYEDDLAVHLLREG